MDRIPPEIKHIIATWISDSYPNLRALSQVDQEWNRIAGSIPYQHIIIPLRKDEVPQRLLCLPNVKRVLANVRQLSIVAEWPPVYQTHQRTHNYNHIRPALEEVNLGEQVIPRTSAWPQGDWAPAHTTNQWVISPLLHTVHMTCFEKPNHRQFREHPDRVLRIVLLAPHIERVALQVLALGSTGPKGDFNDRVHQLEREMTSVRAKLEVLSWPLKTKMTAGQFQKWDAIIDYSCLLDLTSNYRGSLPLLAVDATHLALFPPSEDDLGTWPASEAMFESLPPLTYLCLLGAYEPTILTKAAVRKHGPALSELRLHKGSRGWKGQDLRRLSNNGQIGPIFSPGTVLELGAQSPSLQKLRICLQRRRGLETDAYTTLAQFPHLTELDLLLNCLAEIGSNETPVPPRELTEFEKAQTTSTSYDLPIWYLRDPMMNCAIDKDLAKTIFTHIRYHQGGRHLERLTIHPLYSQVGQYCYYSANARHTLGPFNAEIFKVLAPTRTVETDLLTSLRAVKCVQRHSNQLGSTAGDMQMSLIYNSIWPAQSDDNSRPHEWHSWPLILV
ncbi:hypothetical protein BDV12DRAFT_207327 [Aspergillus spectabilis]